MLLLRKAFLVLGLLAVVPPSEATPIVLDGEHFSITYDDAQVGVYRQGRLSGSLDTLYFLPTTFAAVTGGAPATTQAGLQFTLSMDPGYVFDGLAFAENGSYFLTGAGRVGASASLQAVDLDTLAAMTLDLDSGALVQSGRTVSWGLTGMLGAQGLDSARALQISLDNTLRSEPVQGLGFVQGTYVGFRVQTRVQAVPEPSGMALMLAGGLAAVATGRRFRLTRRSI